MGSALVMFLEFATLCVGGLLPGLLTDTYGRHSLCPLVFNALCFFMGMLGKIEL